jgi:pimeloyl-ACP methyl ester carboxylesterase
MTTFALIPGACHGSWCWEFVDAELVARGHTAIPVDLPCDDPTAGFDRYVQVTLAAVADAGPDLVLVAHSLGAHTAVRAAAVRPVAGLLFVCGVIPPRAGERNHDEPEMEAPGAFDGLAVDDENRFWFPDPADAIDCFFHDCPLDLAAWAATQLRRQSRTPHAELGELVGPPEVPCVSIVCEDDRVASAAWGRWAARERLLGAPVVELPGSHSPFLSRPAVLTDRLVDALAHL